ncbi:MAG: hypothetical protein M0P71_16550 [Melioribacteraceae bacterium]|jgi:heme O synthase-like polyprenyltransferase|nr:hypothetical protein [Melioribacteraceae bacterium]
MKKTREIYMLILGALIVIGFFVLLYILVYSGIPETNKEILNIVVGALIGSFTGVVGYFFGSSIGSKDKADIMNGGQK